MREITLVLSLWLGLAGAASNQEGGPDPADVKVAEANLSWRYPRPLATYDRYYEFSEFRGRRVIHGVFVSGRRPGGAVHIAPPAQVPEVFDGGCGVIEVYIDIQTKTSLAMACHGEPLPPWQPH